MFNQSCNACCDASFQPYQHNYNQQSKYFNDSLQTYTFTNPKSNKCTTHITNKNTNDTHTHHTTYNNIESYQAYQSLQNNHYEVPTLNHRESNSSCGSNCTIYHQTSTNSSDNVTYFQDKIKINDPTPNQQTNTNYNQNSNQCNNMTILEDTMTLDTLLYTLKKGITNSQNALVIAKMVSILINKTESHANAKKIVKRLTNENIVNMLTNAITKYSSNPQIIKESQWALNLMVKTLLVDNRSSEHVTNGIQIGSEQSKNEKGKQGYKCENCGKIYKHLCNLKTHQKIHTESCYICSFCNKRFGRKYNFTEHIRVHTGESPFECTVCHKRFKQKHGLKNHFKKSHLDSH